MKKCIFAAAAGLIAATSAMAEPDDASPEAAKWAKPAFQYMPGSAFKLDGNALGYSASTDLDGDQVDEVLLATGSFPKQQSTSLPILKWDGASFRNAVADYLKTAPKSQAFTDVVIDDFNKDGRSDAFLGAFGYDDVPFPGSRDVLLLQTKNGKLKNAGNQVHRKANTTYYATSGDINGDEIPDIFVVTLETAYKNGPHFLVSKAPGKFSVRRDLINPAYAASGGTETISAAAIADIDNDGRNDLVIGREDGSYVGVYFNDGGSFNRDAPDYKLPKLAHGKGNSHPLDIRPIDFDLDGFVDLAIFSAGWPNFFPFSLQFYRNIGGKSFKDVTAKVLRNKPKVRGNLRGLDRLRAVDFYGDGLVDLIGVSEQGFETSSLIFINTGAGGFREYDWSFFRDQQGHPYRTVIPADLNGDGLPDLVTTSLIKEGKRPTFHFEAYLNGGVADADVKKAPVIATGPKPAKLKKGDRLHLSVLVSGDRPFTFRWTRNGKTIQGATGPVLTVDNVTKSNGGKYAVEVSNAAGTVTSATARVRVR